MNTIPPSPNIEPELGTHAEILPHEIQALHARISAALAEAVAVYDAGETPIYDQMVVERREHDPDALEILEAFREIEAHRDLRAEEVVRDARRTPAVIKMTRQITGRATLADFVNNRKTAAEIRKELFDLEAEIGGEAFSSFTNDSEIREQKFSFSRNTDNPQQVDCFYSQFSDNPSKNVTIWYKVTPHGIAKVLSYNHEPAESRTQYPLPMKKDAEYDEVLALKIGSFLYLREVKKYFAEPINPKHRQS